MSRVPVVGVIRLLAVAAAGVGLVHVAQQGTATVDLRARPVVADAGSQTRQVLLQHRLLPCSGQELSGTVGVPDIPTTGSVSLAAPPPALLQAARSESSGAANAAGAGAAGSAGAGAAGAAGSANAAGSAKVAGSVDATGSRNGAGSESALSILVGGRPATGAARSTSPLTPATAALPAGAATVVARGDGELAPAATAAQEWRSDSDTLRGLAGSACVTPASEHWLIAGGGAAGRQERLVLTNPGANEVSVGIEVLGAKGPVESATERRVVVPGSGRAAVLVDAIAGSEPTPVVHLVVTGGTVAATLTDTWLDGAVPQGAETVGPAAQPAVRQVIPVTRRPLSGALRIAVPGDTQAVVSARLITPQGPRPLAGGGVHRVQAGSVLELPLAAAVQVQAIEVRSDVPVVAAAMSRVGAQDGVGELAWSAGAPAITTLAGAAFPAGEDAPRRALSLVASGGAVTADVAVVASGRVTTTRVRIGADTLVVHGVGSPSAVWVRPVDGPGQLRAGVLSESGEGSTMMLSALDLRDLPLTRLTTSALPLP